MPKVSVVIPTYNQAELLREALESVRAQTMTDWEAMIINNHSVDNTVQVINEFSEPRFQRIDFANDEIIAASRNKGIELSSGEWVAFLDSDDLWASNKLEISLAEAGNSDLLCHREATVKNGGTVSISPHFTPADATYRRLLFERNCFSPTAVMVRRNVLEQVRGFSKDRSLVTCEDHDLWLRLAARGVRVRFVDRVLSTYRLHDANTSTAVDRHLNAGLAVITQHYEAMESKKPLDWIRLQRRLAMIIYGAARNCQKAGNNIEARRYFARSLLLFPFYTRSLIFGLIAFMKGMARSSDGV